MRKIISRIDWVVYLFEQFVLAIATMFILCYVSGKLARQGLDYAVDYYLGGIDLLEVERVLIEFTNKYIIQKGINHGLSNNG